MTSFDPYVSGYEAELRRAVPFGVGDIELFAEAKAVALLEVARARLGTLDGVRSLDVGCGLGGIHHFLGGLARNLRGVDISPSMIEAASARNPARAYDVYDGGKLPYDDASFDFTFTICVLHHVDLHTRPEFVGELRRVTRPGGVVAIVEHNPLNPFTRLVVRRCEFDKGVVLVPSRQARSFLSAVGCSDYRARYILLTPFRSRVLRSLENHLGRLPMGAQYVASAIRMS